MPNATNLEEDDKDSLYSVDSLDEQANGVNIESGKSSKNEVTDERIIRRCVEDKTDIDLKKNGDILVPFYSGDLSLQEIRILQNNARKKVKGLARKPVLGVSDYNGGNCKETLISLDRLPPRADSSCSNKSDDMKLYCSSDNQRKSDTEGAQGGRSRSAMKGPGYSARGKSMSYLERFRKKLEATNKGQGKAQSVCSTVGDTSCRNRSPLSCSDVSDPDMKLGPYSVTACSVDDEEFYRSILNNDPQTKQSSSNSSLYNSCDESCLLSETLNSYPKQRVISNQAKTEINSARNNNKLKQKNGDIRKGKTEFSNATLGKLGTLGPDIVMTKQKLEVFLKRKEYGNNVSCKNRLDIIQKRETFALKPDLSAPIESTKMPVPVVTFTVDPTANVLQESSNTCQETPLPITKPIKKMVKKINLNLNAVEKKQRDQKGNNKGPSNGVKNNPPLDENAAQILLKRHELEKKMADRIRDQFAN